MVKKSTVEHTFFQLQMVPFVSVFFILNRATPTHYIVQISIISDTKKIGPGDTFLPAVMVLVITGFNTNKSEI